MIDAAKPFGSLLLFRHIDAPGDHHPLRLGRSGSVHGFGEISHSSCPQGEIFNQPEDPHACFGRDVFTGFIIFFDPFGGFRTKRSYGSCD